MKRLLSGESRAPCQPVVSQPALCPVSAAGLRGPVSGMIVFSLGEDRGARANFLQNRLLGRKPEEVSREAHGGTGTAVPRRSPARFHMISIREGHPAVSHHLLTRVRGMLMSTEHPVSRVSCIFRPRSLFLPLGAHLILQYSLFYSPRPFVAQNIHVWIQFTECLVALLVLNTK